MRLRPLELARPIVLGALVVSVVIDRAERIPVGISCYCILPDRRTIAGITSPLYYLGRVSPYFNLNPPPVPRLIK